MATEYISREAAIKAIMEHTGMTPIAKLAAETTICRVPAADVRPIPDGGIGEMSDGYHTFNGLYHQRMMLFAALVKAYKDKAWKSYKHEDGELCFGGGWFIVGIDTPAGSYTYHYESKDFDLFDCVELSVAKHWDGHTEADVGRLMSLYVRPVVREKWKHSPDTGTTICTACGWSIEECFYDASTNKDYPFCPACGADMRKVVEIDQFKEGAE